MTSCGHLFKPTASTGSAITSPKKMRVNLHSVPVTAYFFMTLAAWPARAQLYEYQPQNGLTIYSNVRSQAAAAPNSPVMPSLVPSPSRSLSVPLAEPVVPPRLSSISHMPRASGAGRSARGPDSRRKLNDDLQYEQYLLDAAIAEGSDASIIRRHREQIAALTQEIAKSK